jgi:hypothetical protein
MFRSLSYDHYWGSITVLVQLLLIGVHTSSYSGLWPYVVGVSVHPMCLSLWLGFNLQARITDIFNVRSFKCECDSVLINKCIRLVIKLNVTTCMEKG